MTAFDGGIAGSEDVFGQPPVDQRQILGIEPQDGGLGIVGEHACSELHPAAEQVAVDLRLADHLADELQHRLTQMTGEPIAIRRLEARPIATLSVEAQERHERRERVYRDD